MTLRIIGGELRGRKFDLPDELPLRPMSDRVREALFNVLGPLDDLNVLDAFAGSGALSFEALSRGAARATLLERHSATAEHIAANAEELGLTERIVLIPGQIEDWLVDNSAQFELIFSDPPYAELEAEVQQALAAVLAPSGTLVLSHSARVSPPELTSCELVTTRTYGSRAITFYKTLLLSTQE